MRATPLEQLQSLIASLSQAAFQWRAKAEGAKQEASAVCFLQKRDHWACIRTG